MPITFGGQTATEAVAAQQQKQFEEQRQSGQIKDPIAVPRNRDPYHLQSLLSDYTLWVEQMLSEMSALALKRHRLVQQLKDPARQEMKGIDTARARRKQWDTELLHFASDIATLEANADRIWQAMSRDDRALYQLDWQTPPEQKRLIGKAWTVKAQAFPWPVGYSVGIDSFRFLLPYLRQELKDVIGERTLWLGAEPPI